MFNPSMMTLTRTLPLPTTTTMPNKFASLSRLSLYLYFPFARFITHVTLSKPIRAFTSYPALEQVPCCQLASSVISEKNLIYSIYFPSLLLSMLCPAKLIPYDSLKANQNRSKQTR